MANFDASLPSVCAIVGKTRAAFLSLIFALSKDKATLGVKITAGFSVPLFLRNIEVERIGI